MRTAGFKGATEAIPDGAGHFFGDCSSMPVGNRNRSEPGEQSGRAPILYAVTVDTEEEWDWSAGWPVRSHGTENLAEVPRFQRLCADRGAHVTWFFDWLAAMSEMGRELLGQLAARSDAEVGMHIHPWTTPPHRPGRGNGERDSFLATYPADEIREKLDSVWEAFQEAGVSPKTFRGGRYSSGGAIHRYLVERGFVADASVVPYTRWPDDGAPEYRDRDIFPRRLAYGNGSAYLWEIPVTLGFTRRNFAAWSRRYERLSQSPLRVLRPIGIMERMGIVQRVWLNFEDTPAASMLALLRTLRELRPPCITLTVHSSSLYPGGNPYSQTEAQVTSIWETAETVLDRLADDPDFRAATVFEIAQSLEEQHEGHRH